MNAKASTSVTFSLGIFYAAQKAHAQEAPKYQTNSTDKYRIQLLHLTATV